MLKKYQIGLVVYADRDEWQETIQDLSAQDIRVMAMPHRYLAAGIENKLGFTGRVFDYTGGGNFEDRYYLDGIDLGIASDPNTGAMDDDQQADLINQVYPGLLDQVDKLLKPITQWDPYLNCIVAPAKFIKLYLAKTKRAQDLYRQGKTIHNPPAIGLTSFT